VLSASLGGLVYQLSLLLLPKWVRCSRLYQATVERLLRILVELLGDVQGAFPAEDMSALRTIEMRWMPSLRKVCGATSGVSPVRIAGPLPTTSTPATRPILSVPCNAGERGGSSEKTRTRHLHRIAAAPLDEQISYSSVGFSTDKKTGGSICHHTVLVVKSIRPKQSALLMTAVMR
jgi:hypothetical protein